MFTHSIIAQLQLYVSYPTPRESLHYVSYPTPRESLRCVEITTARQWSSSSVPSPSMKTARQTFMSLSGIGASIESTKAVHIVRNLYEWVVTHFLTHGKRFHVILWSLFRPYSHISICLSRLDEGTKAREHFDVALQKVCVKNWYINVSELDFSPQIPHPPFSAWDWYLYSVLIWKSSNVVTPSSKEPTNEGAMCGKALLLLNRQALREDGGRGALYSSIHGMLKLLVPE